MDWLSTCRRMGRRLPERSAEQRTALPPTFRDQKLKLEELLQQADAVATVN
ncbi:hypothetical protein ACIGW8_06535 [Streptomyces sioyaensis]|uniref:hypothetical protein n=1 Tax=Streptomyces sioyaensis TaxID=67364 RepID=UPI0037D6A46C